MGIKNTRHRRSKIGLGDEYDLLSVTSAQVAGVRVFPRGALDDYDHAASLGVPTTGLPTEERRGAAAASGRAVKSPLRARRRRCRRLGRRSIVLRRLKCPLQREGT